MKTDSYEIRDERFNKCVNLSEPIERIWTGGRWTEGPVYQAATGQLTWSDIPNDRRLRWDELSGVISELRKDQGRYTNGSTLDLEGRIVMCEHGTRSVTRVEHDGSISTLASHYQGNRFNSPNDVVVKRDGTIWFTDPSYGISSDYEGFAAQMEQDGEHVYRLDTDGSITRVTHDFACPNGLAFSLDEKQLYIIDSCGNKYPSGQRHMRRFEVNDDNSLSGGEVFAECENRIFDGMRFDNKGRIWVSADDGVHCYDPDGTLIGKIFIPEPVANLCFAGIKRNRLFITASTSLYAVHLIATGAKIHS